MTKFSKSLAAGLTALALSTAIAATASANGHMGGNRMGGMKMGGSHSANVSRSVAPKANFARSANRATKTGAKSRVEKHADRNQPRRWDTVKGHGVDTDDKHDHFRRDWHRHDHGHVDFVTFVDPPVVVDYIDNPVIGDDAKGKAVVKPAACKWIPVKVSVTNYGLAASDKEKAQWKKSFLEGSVAVAKAFVSKFGTKMQKGVLKAVVEDATISRAMDVLITYACVDANDNVVATKVVGPIEDQYAVHWWKNGKAADGNDHDREVAIAKNRPTAQPVVASK